MLTDEAVRALAAKAESVRARDSDIGRKMGCDMSSETAAAMTLLTPGAPKQ